MRPLRCAMRLSPKWVLVAGVYRRGDWIVQSPGLLNAKLAFEGLELSDGKLSRSVLRGLGVSDAPRLPGPHCTLSNLFDRAYLMKILIWTFDNHN